MAFDINGLTFKGYVGPEANSGCFLQYDTTDLLEDVVDHPGAGIRVFPYFSGVRIDRTIRQFDILCVNASNGSGAYLVTSANSGDIWYMTKIASVSSFDFTQA